MWAQAVIGFHIASGDVFDVTPEYDPAVNYEAID